MGLVGFEVGKAPLLVSEVVERKALVVFLVDDAGQALLLFSEVVAAVALDMLSVRVMAFLVG